MSLNRLGGHLFAWVFMAFLFASGCTDTPNGETVTLRFGYRPTVAVDLALLQAVQDGEFAKNRITVELVPYGRADLLFAALQSNEIQGSAGIPLEPILGLASKNEYPYQGYLIWYFDPQNPYDGFIVPKDSSIKSLGDLAGKSVGTHPSKQVTYFLQRMLPGASLRQYNPASPLLTLEAGEVDAVYVLEPVITQALASGKYRLVEPAAISRLVFSNQRVPAALSLLKASWITENSAAARTFVETARAAFLKSQDKPDTRWKANLLTDKRFGGFSPDVAVKVREPVATLPEQLQPGDMERFLQILRDGNLVSGGVDPAKLFYVPGKE